MQRQPRQQRSSLPETPLHPSRPSFSRSRPSTRAQLLVTLFLAILLGTEVISNFSTVPSVHAATLTPPSQGKFNSKTAQQMGNPDTQHPHGSFVRPSSIPPTPKSSQKNTKGTPPASVEPAKMKPAAYQLNTTFIKKPAQVQQPASPTTTPSATKTSQATPSTSKTLSTQSTLKGKPLKKSNIQVSSQAAPSSGTLVFKGSDGRWEVDLPPGSLDLSQATLSDGSAPVGAVSLQIGQDSGHYRAERSFLGTYIIQVVDSQNNVVQGVRLLQPLTLRYHYQTGELDNLGIDPRNIHLTWPEAISTALDTKQSLNGLDVSMTNDASTSTLTAQTTQLAGTATVSGEPA